MRFFHNNAPTSIGTMTSYRATTNDPVKAVTRHRLLIGFIAAMTALVAQASGPQTLKLSLQAQKDHFREKCFKLEVGQLISYQLNTPHPIDFNLHHHPSEKEVVYPDKLVVKSRHSKQLVAQSGGSYCFMAKNLADQPAAFDVVIDYEITAQ